MIFTPFSRKIGRKAGLRMVPSEDVGSPQPTPILSLEGMKGGCSAELQSLIQTFRSDGQAAEDALMDYIEGELGQSIEEAYPTEWAAAGNGERQTIEVDLGVDVLTLTLDLCSSGAEPGDNPLQIELVALSDAVNASPTQANINALFDFIEEHTGETIEELVGAEWADIIASGETVIAQIPIPSIGASIILVLGGTLNATTNCANLDTYVLNLEQQDFGLPPIYVGTDPRVETYPGQGFQYVERGPGYEIHVDNMRLKWLFAGTTGALTEPWRHTPGVSSFTAVPVESPAGSGNLHRAFLQVKSTIKHYPTFRHNYSPATPGTPTHVWEYVIRQPPMQFLVRRLNPAGGTFPTIDDAPREGTIIGSGPGLIADCDYPITNWTAGAASGIAWGFGPEGLNRNYLGEIAKHPWIELNAAILAVGTEEWTDEGEMEAWNLVQGAIDQWEIDRSDYDPEVAYDDIDRSITVSYTTDENAMYIEVPGCRTSDSFAGQYDQVVLTWGSYHVYRANDSHISLSPTYIVTDPDHLGYAQRRVIQDTDVYAGNSKTNIRRVTAAQAGQYTPIIDTATPEFADVCPKDARCITAGPP